MHSIVDGMMTSLGMMTHNRIHPCSINTLGCFWAYIRQPHDHIGWATSMPFASINHTNSKTNPRNFHQKNLRFGGFENLRFFLIGHLEKKIKKKFFASFPWKSVKVSWVAKLGQKDLFNMSTGCIVDGDFLLPNEIDSWNFQACASFMVSWSLSKFELI